MTTQQIIRFACAYLVELVAVIYFTLFIGAVTVIGPPRDYLIAATFPKWMVFAPGVAPILADAPTYAGMVALGHALMHLIAGPGGPVSATSQESRLTHRQFSAPLSGGPGATA